jgi:hypothetical protein
MYQPPTTPPDLPTQDEKILVGGMSRVLLAQTPGICSISSSLGSYYTLYVTKKLERFLGTISWQEVKSYLKNAFVTE